MPNDIPTLQKAMSHYFTGTFAWVTDRGLMVTDELSAKLIDLYMNEKVRDGHGQYDGVT